MKRHSLLFGIQQYPDSGALTRLKCPHTDVDALAQVLGDPRYMGEVGEVVVHKDVTFPEAQRAFSAFLRQVDREDVALVHFSGHGMKDDDGDLYLCFTDAVETELHFTALNVKTFGEWLEKQRLRRMLVTLDCCYAGAAGALMTRGGAAAPLKAAERPRPDGTGLYILSAASATETAKEGNGRGVFSHYLVEGIRTGAADSNQDGEITVSELADYLHREVQREAAQTPHMTAHKASGTFMVAQNPIPIEREAARRAAEAEAAARAAREATLAAGLEKVKQHVAFGSFGLGFGGEVESWIADAGRRSDLGDAPQLALLARFAEGRLSAVEFHDGWREAAVPAEARAAAERDKAARAEVEAQRLAWEKAEGERAETERRERAARAEVEAQRTAWGKAETERKAREQRERATREGADRKAREAAERAREEAERELAALRQAAHAKPLPKKRRWVRWLLYLFVGYIILAVIGAIVAALNTPSYY